MNFSYEKRCANRGGASDSSQMSSVLSHNYIKEVQEAVCVKEQAKAFDAVPFDDSKEISIAIINGKIANADDVLDCDILVENGKIAKICKNMEIPEGAHVIDARDKFVLPGIIDYNARLVSRTGLDFDLIAERTKSSILGGTTTLVDLLHNVDWDTSSEWVKALEEHKEEFYCDIAVKVCPQADTTEQLSTCSQAVGLTTIQLSPEQLLLEDDEQLLELLRAVKAAGGVINVDTRRGALLDTILNGNSIMTPAEDLEEAVARKLCALALQVDVPVCLLNLANPSTADVLALYRERGLTVYGEVLTDLGATNEMPLKNNNLILASHMTGLNTDKMSEEGEEAEDWTSVVYHELVGKDRIDISKFVELTSTNPARLMNLYPRKGCVKEDSDADLVIWDPMVGRPVSGRSRLAFQLGGEAEVYGGPEAVLLAGRLVVSDAQLRPMAKHGKYLAMEPFPASQEDPFKEAVRLERADRPRDVVEDNKDSRRGWDKRKCMSQGEIFDKELGIYQRPLSAHGVKNQQDSTFTVKTFF